MQWVAHQRCYYNPSFQIEFSSKVFLGWFKLICSKFHMSKRPSFENFHQKYDRHTLNQRLEKCKAKSRGQPKLMCPEVYWSWLQFLIQFFLFFLFQSCYAHFPKLVKLESSKSCTTVLLVICRMDIAFARFASTIVIKVIRVVKFLREGYIIRML